MHQRTSETTAAQIRQITREAYTYAYPMVDAYRIEYAYFVAKGNPEYKGAWNVIHNIPRVYTPKDKAVQTPNSDTPYSMVGMDLRTEPIVLTVPRISADRYFSIQLVDAYTFNYAYIGTRATGNDGGSFMIVGPKWNGATPAGITSVIRCETELAVAIYRTQLFDPSDLDNVKAIQAQYQVRPLSAFLGVTGPPPTEEIVFPLPLSVDEQKTSLEIFGLLNFLLQFCPTHPSETKLMERFASIGIGAGKPFDVARFSDEQQQAMRDGIADAWAEISVLQQKVMSKEIASGDLFGTRDALKNNYAYRMIAAILGIFGNSKEEAMYPVYTSDADGAPLDGTQKYTLRFAPGQLPPVKAFWSITMYEMPSSLLVDNPIDRYLINSPMLPTLNKDTDGGITIYVQNTSPGADRESNWLPAPAGPFRIFLRLYGPQEAALNGAWQMPPLQRVER